MRRELEHGSERRQLVKRHRWYQTYKQTHRIIQIVECLLLYAPYRPCSNKQADTQRTAQDYRESGVSFFGFFTTAKWEATANQRGIESKNTHNTPSHCQTHMHMHTYTQTAHMGFGDQVIGVVTSHWTYWSLLVEVGEKLAFGSKNLSSQQPEVLLPPGADEVAADALALPPHRQRQAVRPVDALLHELLAAAPHEAAFQAHREQTTENFL